jgi:hypothetical protein
MPAITVINATMHPTGRTIFALAAQPSDGEKMRRFGLNGQLALCGLAAAGAALLASFAAAHSAVCSCFDNGDDTITCEGGFSDGSSAAGVAIRVLDDRERVLLEGKMDDAGAYSFKKPEVDYHVVFDAGQSHVVTIYGGDIVE